MRDRAMMRLGGLSYLLAASAFSAVFGYLALYFDYPAILEGSAAEVLPRLRQGGETMRAVWGVYAMLPMLLVPAIAGSWAACPSSGGRMRVAFALACIAALAMTLGLMRWPSVHWVLAQAWVGGGVTSRVVLAAQFEGLNVYLGNYVGEFLGETTLAASFALCARSYLVESTLPRWLGWSGLAFAALFLLGAFRNVSELVQPVADLNNALLPLWLVASGIALLRGSRRDD